MYGDETFTFQHIQLSCNQLVKPNSAHYVGKLYGHMGILLVRTDTEKIGRPWCPLQPAQPSLISQGLSNCVERLHTYPSAHDVLIGSCQQVTPRASV